jgi:hypothetical protein
MTRKRSSNTTLHLHLAATALLLCAATLACAEHARADDAPVPSAHQLMKECMAKQKASESGKTHADMRKACRDVTKNEKQNDERAAGDTAPAQK